MGPTPARAAYRAALDAADATYRVAHAAYYTAYAKALVDYQIAERAYLAAEALYAATTQDEKEL